MSLHFRAPMRSRRDDIDPYAGAERGLAVGWCGIGGRLDHPPADLAEAVAQTERVHGEQVARRLTRFAAVPSGSSVWTRDADGTYHHGVLGGGWCYDDSPAAHAVDLVHVRRTTWEPVDDADVPPAVIATFRRGGRNFQQIRALTPQPSQPSRRRHLP